MDENMFELKKAFWSEKKKVELKMKQFAKCSNSIEYWILKGKLDELDYALKLIEEKINAQK